MLLGQKVGPFLIDKELGSGAMGTVYRGVYTQSGIHVAIKIMAPGLGTTNSNAAQRFEREAAILKQLKHPNIVRLLGIGKTHGTRYYAMEYVEGESLDKVMARRERMTWEEIVSLGQQLCSALQHAHEKGVIHRDLKPSNLMILRDGTLKLTDFGIAKDLDSTALTSANCTVGTASYMSPEQCRGERDLTYKSDLYSLGIVFYELVTGRKPFNADNAMEMFMQHVSGTFERPSRLIPELPVWFDNLICQLLEKKAEHRPLNATMVAETLGSIQEKVEAQLSAGVVAVRSRRVDRPRDSRKLDEADREAARALKGLKRKKTRKTAGPRFYERAWFVAAALVSLMILTSGLVYLFFLRPPSLDQLYARSQPLMESSDPAKWDQAMAGPLREFREHYREAPGEKAEQMRHWIDDARYRQCFALIAKHLERVKSGKPHFAATPEEEIAFPAALAEENGDFAKATAGWEQLQSEAGGGAWGVFATRRLAEMQRAATEEERLAKELLKIKQFRRELDPNNPDHALLTALRYEQFGDALAARQEYEKIKAAAAADPANRVIYLFAAKKVVDLKPEVEKKFGAADPLTVRVNLIDGYLKKAEETADQGRGEAYTSLLNIIALYKENPETEIKDRVAKARQLKKTLAKEMGLADAAADS